MLATDRSALGPLRFLLVATIVGPILLFAGAAWYNYGATFRDAEHELVRASEVAREHAAKVFDANKLIADHVLDLARGMDDAAVVGAEAALHEKFRRVIAEVPQVQSILLIDRHGDSLVGTADFPMAHVINVADRDYFQAMRDAPLDVYLSEVFVGRHNQVPAFSVSRRRTGLDGGFDGLVAVAVSPGYFAEFDQSLVGEDAVVTLLRDDGQVIIRYPSLAGAAPKLAPTDHFFAAAAANPGGSTYQDDAQLDGESRLFAFKKVPRYPAYVVVGRPVASIKAAWRRTMASHLLFGVPATAGLFLLSLIALRRARAESLAVLQAQQEIRRREAAEDALRQAQKLEAIGQLTGGVAHDFNNLLTAVLGNLELVDMRLGDGKLRQMIQTASRAAQRGAALTQQLLAFSRKQHLVPAPVDLNATVSGMCDMLGRTLGGTVEIVTDLDPSLWPGLVDPTQIELAILNLTINARDAMSGGGTVVIATRNLESGGAAAYNDLVPGDYVMVSVTDSGEGMSDEVKSRAFEPFYTTKEVGKGSGLGLSQVYGLARQSGGTVSLRSTLGQGTVVELVLPRATEARRSAEPGLLADVFERRRGLVLVVDDQDDVREVAVAQLSALGYETLEAASGKAAITLVRAGAELDLLLVDYAMPGMDGMELLRILRRMKPDLPAVLVTGYAEQGAIADEHESVCLLKKPYRIHELAAKVDAVLRASDPLGNVAG